MEFPAENDSVSLFDEATKSCTFASSDINEEIRSWAMGSEEYFIHQRGNVSMGWFEKMEH